MECKKRGLTVGYVVPIARAKFKRELAECTTNMIWKLVFDVRQRKKKIEPQMDADGHGCSKREEDPF